MRPPPEDVVANDCDGRSPGLRIIASLGLPGASGSSGTSRNACRSQLRGQPRLRAKLSPRSLLRPAGAGTDQARVQRPQDASQAVRQVRIDKASTPTIKCRIDGLSRESEQGMWCGTRGSNATAAPATVSGEPVP